MDPRGPKHYIFGDHFYSKNARMLRFHVFHKCIPYILMPENIWSHHFTWNGPNSQEIVN